MTLRPTAPLAALRARALSSLHALRHWTATPCRAGAFRTVILMPAMAPCWAFGLAPAAQAEVRSADEVVQARILPGWREGDGRHMAALQLDLAPGWKTYWRSPGEAGIPPQFDWSGSQNVAAVTLHWPTPSVFSTNGMTTLGYDTKLVLPVEIRPITPNAPIVLALRMDLGVCEFVCVPASLQLQERIEGHGKGDGQIEAALRDVPRPARAAGLRDIRCKIEPIADGLRLTAQLALPRQGREEVVAIETGDPRIWVSEALEQRSGDILTATSDLVGPSGQPFALERGRVVVTVISGNGAFEVRGCPAG